MKYEVLILAKEGVNPITGKKIESSEEIIFIEAKTKVNAKEKALKATKLQLRGQEVVVYINGELFADPRW